MRIFQFLASAIAVCLCSTAWCQPVPPGDRPTLQPQSGHRMPVTHLAFIAGGKLLVSSDMNGTTLIWNHESGLSRDITPPSAKAPGFASMLVNDLTGEIAMLPYDGAPLEVVGIVDGKRRGPPPVPPLERIALSADRTTVGAVTKSGTLMLFDAKSWKPIALNGAACAAPLDERPGDNYGNQDFLFHPDGRKVLIAANSGAVAEIDLFNGCTQSQVLPALGHPHLVVTLSPRADAIAMAYQGNVSVRTFAGAAPARAVMQSNDGLRRLQFSADGSGLFAGISNGELQFADLKKEAPRHWKFADGLTGMAIDGSMRVAAGLFSGTIRMVPLGAGDEKDIAAKVLVPIAVSEDITRSVLLVRTDSEVLRIDLASARVESLYRSAERERYVDMSDDGRVIWSGGRGGGGTLLRAESGWAASELPPGIPVRSSATAVAPDGKSLALSYGTELRRYDARSGAFDVIGKLPHPATSLAFSRDGAWLAAVGEAQAFGLVSMTSKKQYPLVGPSETGTAFAFSGDSSQVAFGQSDGSVRRFDLRAAQALPARIAGTAKVTALRYSPDSSQLAIGRSTGAVDIVDLASGAVAVSFVSMRSAVNSLVFLAPSMLVAVATGGEIRVSDIVGRRDMVSLYLLPEKRWLAVAPDGKFDLSDIDSLEAVSWRMPDDPLRPLSPEMFMRDFYEPRLISRLIACHARLKLEPSACASAFTPVRPLASLNRVQPGVRIAGVRKGATPDEAIVDVEVSPGNDPTQPNNKTTTAVYDLHLLRDGQLVQRLPSLVPVPAGRPSAIRSLPVRLASGRRGRPVTFGAYAFNEDRVKGPTATDDSYVIPASLPVRQPKAYVIAIGVDSYDLPSRALRFAASDARAMEQALARIKGYSVVPVVLVSEGTNQARWQATKENVRAVLARLAGAPAGDGQLMEVRNAGKLARATPDDLVILTFSGHGHTGANGAFYLVPSDSGKDAAVDARALARFISSEELAEWLRPIDAGQIAMIIDACHAGASVDQPGFKPGPMGDRGLGQLAYDKNMRILAASQADDVALESGQLLQGLLTYALVHDGLTTTTGSPGAVTLGDWFRAAERRVPALYDEVRSGTRAITNTRDPTPDAEFGTLAAKRAQTPALFDFARAAAVVEIVKGGADHVPP